MDLKSKEFALSIILYAFLGYLWCIFINHIVAFANSLDHTLLIGGPIIVIGTLLFIEIFHRIAPFNEYKTSHPVKIAGIISYGLVVIVYLSVQNIF